MNAKPGRPRKQGRRTESVWYKPTLRDVYAQVLVARAMLERIRGGDMEPLRRKMTLLEDMLWQMK